MRTINYSVNKKEFNDSYYITTDLPKEDFYYSIIAAECAEDYYEEFFPEEDIANLFPADFYLFEEDGTYIGCYEINFIMEPNFTANKKDIL